jgi:pimeloyl-ACP methyl ester carboxylesterase
MLSASIVAQDAAPAKDNSSHRVRFVEVAPGVKLEVLDWGGTGRPLVFLAGMGFTAHEFDDFAPKFAGDYHVYGITRRGFGASSAPAPEKANYAADRLGDDVLAVIHALSLKRPVLVGHSLGGEELSSVASRYPDKVAGLVYLDAAYEYAFYDAKHGDLVLDSVALKNNLDAFLSAKVPDVKSFLEQLQSDVTRYSNDIQSQLKTISLLPSQPHHGDPPPIFVAVSAGKQKYTRIPVPGLAIFAVPHAELAAMYPDNPSARAAVMENDRAATTTQADAFKAGVPNARVVLLPNASHFVFKSNEAEVEREMRAFLATLQ